MIRAAVLVLFAAPAAAQQAAPDPHTRVMAMFETVCLRGANDFSNSNQGFFAAGLEQKDDGYWIDPLSQVIGAARSSEGGEQHLCSIGLVGGDVGQLAEILPNVLPGVWDAGLRRVAGGGGRSDIWMSETDAGVRAAWVDLSEGDIAVLMTSFTVKGSTGQ